MTRIMIIPNQVATTPALLLQNLIKSVLKGMFINPWFDTNRRAWKLAPTEISSKLARFWPTALGLMQFIHHFSEASGLVQRATLNSH